MGGTRCTDPFGVLGVPSTASRAEVKSAFRRLVLRHHPDVDRSPQAAARFTELKLAADMILKGHRAAPSSTAEGAASARGAWQAYAGAAAGAHGGWRPRSRNTALWFCAATLVGGCGIFYGALVAHEWFGGYDWQTPAQVEGRLHHPTLRRQQLLHLMMEGRQQQQQGKRPPDAA